jgi:hypothetical protein
MMRYENGKVLDFVSLLKYGFQESEGNESDGLLITEVSPTNLD